MASDPRYPGARSQAKNGRLYWRLRKDGKDIALPGQPGDSVFDAAYEKAMMASAEVFHLRTVTGLNGKQLPERSYWHAWMLFKATAQFHEFDPKTQADHTRKAIEFAEAQVYDDLQKMRWDEVLVADTEVRQLRSYLDTMRIAFPTKPNHMLRTLKKLVEVAIREGWIEPEQDPTLSLKYAKPQATQQSPWPLHIRHQFESFHKIGTAARTCYALALHLGNRRGDVAELRWGHLVYREIEEDDWQEVIEFHQGKNKKATGGQHMVLSIPEPLREVLDALPRDNGTILKTAQGQPFSDKALTTRMRHWCEQAGIEEGYTLHGLRRTFGTSLAENGVNVVAIQHAMGHSEIATTQLYVKDADRTKSMLSVRKAQDKIAAREDAQKLRMAGARLKVVK